MALQFKVYEKSQDTLTSLGKIHYIVPGGKLRFVPGTIERYNLKVIKSMNMIIKDQSGASTTCPLSKTVSAVVKKALDSGTSKEDVINAIFQLEIGENEKEQLFIMKSASDNEEEYSYNAASNVTLEDLMLLV